MNSVQDDIFKTFEDRVMRLSLCTRSPNAPEKQIFLGNAFIVYFRRGTCLLMTCNHCLEKQDLGVNQNYRLDFSKLSSPGFKASVACRDSDRDLALLRVDGLQQKVLHFTFEETEDVFKSGSEVVLLAFYAKDEFVLDEPGAMLGKIVGLPDTTTPELALIRANYTAKPGASGSPVILATSRNVIGVHCEGESAAKYAVSIQSVKAALRIWSGQQEGSTAQFMLEEIALNG